MSKQLRGSIMLFITALIWGSAFVAQSAGMDYVGPLTYNGVRMVIGGLVLIPVIPFLRKLSNKGNPIDKQRQKMINKESIKAGLVCGIFLCLASTIQQIGISYTTVGKAGFITALYIVIVPIMGIFIGKKIPKIIWLCVVIAVVGFYMLCIKEDFTISSGDLIMLLCAVLFSLQIMAVDHYIVKDVDGVLISCVQFLTTGIICCIGMFIFETPTFESILSAKWTILYAGVLSSGVAYTLQILGQRDTEPTVATLIMSLESVFAALFGWLILKQGFSAKEFVGCVFVFAAVILAQIPLPVKNKSTTHH